MAEEQKQSVPPNQRDDKEKQYLRKQAQEKQQEEDKIRKKKWKEQEDKKKIHEYLKAHPKGVILPHIVSHLRYEYKLGKEYVSRLLFELTEVEYSNSGYRLKGKPTPSAPPLLSPLPKKRFETLIRKLLVKHRNEKVKWSAVEITSKVTGSDDPKKVKMIEIVLEHMPDIQKEDDRFKLFERDFVTNLSCFVLRSVESVQEEWAKLQAISLLSTFLGKITIIKKPPVKLNLYILMIAISGVKKSLPIVHVYEKILKKAGNKLGKDFKLPTKSSVEGFITYMIENKNNEGVLIAHEFSGVFKKARETGYQSDALEFMSDNYDGVGYKRSTITHGKQELESVYVGILAATTPYFLKKMDEDFFIQGTGNRFLYNYYDVKDFEVPSDKEEDIKRDVKEMFSEQEYYKYESEIDDFSTELCELYKKLNGQKPLLTKLNFSEEASIVWRKFEIQSIKKWKELMIDVFNWKGTVINRYPLTVLKLAGIYCISRNYDIILHARTEEDLKDIEINKDDVKRAIDTVMLHHNHYKELLKIREEMKAMQEEVKSHEDKAKTSLLFLKQFPNQMAKQDDLFKKQTITTSPNDFHHFLEIGLDKGWIKIVDKSTIKDKEEQERLSVKTRSIVYKWVK